MYFDDANEHASVVASPDAPMRWVLSLNACALLALGLFWGPLYGWCNQAFGV
jgi:NADH-quinone oxidoreductase subunit N